MPDEASGVGAELQMSPPPSWNLRLDVSRVAQGTDSRPRGSEKVGFGVGYAY